MKYTLKHKPDYALQNIAGKYVVLPAEAQTPNVILTLDEAGAFLWKQLEKDTDIPTLMRALIVTLDITTGTALAIVSQFVQTLWDKNLLLD